MPRVLLINDDETIMDKTAGILEVMGWEVYTATTRQAALWTCIVRQPNLVIIDIEMRDGVGLELISTVHRADRTLFILAVTRGSHDDTLLEVAQASGASHYVIGPISATKLAKALEIDRVNGPFQPGRQ